SLGVEDYILKDELTPMILYKSILYAVERKKSVRALEEFVTERLNYIHEIELQNERLQEISWIQSHMVRAPLARLLGLISLIRGAKDNSGELQYMMNYIEESANELDQVVKEITMRTIVPESDPLLKQAI
ncbi:MAG: hypothetical protein JO080_14840, partial [Mucilaginibacter sp.]|nr:hypothetical protein [Mucilaginibacter sp.]